MKLSFLIFLIVITGLSLYAPNITKRTTTNFKQQMDTFKQDVAPLQKPLDQEQSDTLKNLQSELGVDPNKPLVEVEVVSPVMDKFNEKFEKVIPKEKQDIESLGAIFESFYLKVVNKVKYWISNHNSNITLISFLIVVVAALSKILNFHKLAYLISRLGWFTSRFTLFVFSLIAISLWFTVKKNLWLDIGNNLLIIPLQILIASSVAFKIMDSNYPIWNRLFASFILPIISGVSTNTISIIRIII
ncbi:MAG: hypothetical protein A2539_03080 [Elusimicrobia bacterium RIFOXYD2_FULL_34_15]|nr:MAG: hypothetical protein A2539_03080 [Elusimicrobia bacterium RIFOXYD2_FULL_34_15]